MSKMVKRRSVFVFVNETWLLLVILKQQSCQNVGLRDKFGRTVLKNQI